MDITLAILAAGIGARYGGGVKQLAPVGPNGELIIDYSIHDAIKAGFNKIVFIIRRDIYDDFRDVIGTRMERLFASLNVKWEYVFQEMVFAPKGRVKPWGTGQAVLSCKDCIDGPFAVINADDYYGTKAYEKAYSFLTQNGGCTSENFGMIGYVLNNTLSDNGGVTRGICVTDSCGRLVGINETKNIVKTKTGAAIKDGASLNLNSIVSMNFWMFPPELINALKVGFEQFRKNAHDIEKDEFLLPTIIDEMLKNGKCTVKVVPTEDSWFGITYKEDSLYVRDAFLKLYSKGVYENSLFADLC